MSNESQSPLRESNVKPGAGDTSKDGVPCGPLNLESPPEYELACTVAYNLHSDVSTGDLANWTDVDALGNSCAVL